jgi:hypothetical protein
VRAANSSARTQMWLRSSAVLEGGDEERVAPVATVTETQTARACGRGSEIVPGSRSSPTLGRVEPARRAF